MRPASRFPRGRPTPSRLADSCGAMSNRGDRPADSSGSRARAGRVAFRPLIDCPRAGAAGTSGKRRAFERPDDGHEARMTAAAKCSGGPGGLPGARGCTCLNVQRRSWTSRRCLTGFRPRAAAGHGCGRRVPAHARGGRCPGTCSTTCSRPTASCRPDDQRDAAVASEILDDPKLGPVARNLIMLWYCGTWTALPEDWRQAARQPRRWTPTGSSRPRHTWRGCSGWPRGRTRRGAAAGLRRLGAGATSGAGEPSAGSEGRRPRITTSGTTSSSSAPGSTAR